MSFRFAQHEEEEDALEKRSGRREREIEAKEANASETIDEES